MGNMLLELEVPAVATEYSGTETEKNLWLAFVGESMARNKYDYYASVAKKAGFVEMACVFSAIALNEKEHAKIWLKKLGLIQNYRQNLQWAADGEHYEWTTMYEEMARVAFEEGFDHISDLFAGVADIERSHEDRFRDLITQLDLDEVFQKTGIVMWECKNCGHIEVGKDAPEVCPICNHPRGYFTSK